MAKLLYIEASPRKDRSSSIKVAKAFVDEYKKAHAGDTVETIDLWNYKLPEFDGLTIDSKYVILHGEKHSPEQLKAWKAVEDVIARFKAADKYLFSLPMWNFGIPYKLKHYFDVIVQPTYTFSFTPEEGYKGLVTGKPAAAVYARGGAYQPGTGGEGYDLQKRYMEVVLGFIGFTDIKSVVIEPTLMSTHDEKKTIVDAAVKEAAALAKGF